MHGREDDERPSGELTAEGAHGIEQVRTQATRDEAG